MHFTVAVDGPAAAGKGTVGRAIPARFCFAHLDTGLLYRAVGMIGGDPVAAERACSPRICSKVICERWRPGRRAAAWP